MSSDPGPKKGKGKGKRRGRGRGRGSQPQQQQQSESIPGGLQQRSTQERKEETVQPPPQQPSQQRSTQEREEETVQPPQQQPFQQRSTQEREEETVQPPQQQPSQQAQTPPPLAQAVGQGQEGRKQTPAQSQGKKQQHRRKQSSKADVAPSQTREKDGSGKESMPSPRKVGTVTPSEQKVQPQPTTSSTGTPMQPQPSTTGTKPKVSSPQSQAEATGTRPKTAAKQTVDVSFKPPLAAKAEVKPPLRPDGGGKSGRPISLRVNFIPVKLPQNDIHHYDTEIKAEGMKKGEGYTNKDAPKIIQGIVKQYEKTYPNGPKLVFDKNGKNLFCRCPIPGIEKGKREFKLVFTTDNGKEREYTVEVKWVSQVSLYNLNQALEGRLTEIPYDSITAIEVVLNHLPSMANISVGKSFFSYPDGHEKDLGDGLQIWNGTFVSIRPTQWKMMLNVDTCSTAFYKAQSVLDFMCEYLHLRDIPRSLKDDQRIRFGKEMKTIKIETTHVKRKQKVSGLSKKSSKKEFFDCEGTSTSVFEYFKAKYHITLRYPDLPCLKLGQKGSCIPMELCNIIQGQRKQGRLSANQTREMIRHTALPAPQRMQEINKLIRSTNYDEDPFCRDFGIKVGKDMSQITGRVLDPPVLNYGPQERPCKETPRDGVWSMQQKPMYQPKELKEWAIISYENPQFLNDRGLDNFIRKLVQAGEEKQLLVHHSPCFRAIKQGYEGIGYLFDQLHKNYPNIQIVIVIFPGKGSTDEYYEEVKHFGDVIYGIRTQCLKAKTASKADMQTMANICLKINAKLGGTASVLDKGMRSPILRRPVIIFGADVTHPSPRDDTSPSIAAVVASMDAHPNLYSAEVRVQKHRQEMIAELKDMVKILLQKFRNATGAKPERILFYRDGVSEGQFRDVLLHELSAIQRACLELHESFKPGITFVVVQKRHHTRFFAQNPRDQRGKSKNIPAGTVVDQQVCHPFEFDWYLCSHAGIQGTSKPAHYHVLYDDNNFRSDDLQILTNQLCHTYVRCARAVSIPAPAYYAHHVAFRARYHLSEVERGSGDGSTASGSSGTGLKPEQMIRAVKIHDRINSSMYFA